MLVVNGFPHPRAEVTPSGSPVQAVGVGEGGSPASQRAVFLNDRLLRFGIFELDTRTLELRRDGRLIHLRHQPVQVLQILLERSGELVTRNEITEALWPNDVDVDVEQGLNHCVREIRAALGDRSESPRYVQTLPRRGYRMLAEVQDGHDSRVPAPPRDAKAVASAPAPDREDEPRWFGRGFE